MGTTRLTKVLMDGGSGLNILYSSTLDKMGIPRSNLRPSKAPFYGIVPGKEAVPLGCIRLNVTFGQSDNFHKETLTFEVVDFLDVYHALLDRLCFAKFMVVPNYTYLKLNMPSPCGVIIVGTTFQRAYEYEVECCEHASAIIASKELVVIKKGTTEEAPDSKRSDGSFEPMEGIKEVLVDPSSFEGKVVRIGIMLSFK